MTYNPKNRRLLGYLKSVNMNSTSDQEIKILNQSSYMIRSITMTNSSANLSASSAAGGIYPLASKNGTALVANTQAYTSLTGSTARFDLTLATPNTRYTTDTLYFSLTTGHGSAATADIYIYGDVV